MIVERKVKIDTDDFKIGDIIAFTLTDGEEVEAMAVKQEEDGMIFVLVDCLRKEYQMNEEDSNRGGFLASDLRKKLNGKILDRFPAEIREKMIAFANSDYLRLPTEREIFGVNKYGEDEGNFVTQWEPMKDRRNRIAFQGSKTGTWEWYWLQNKVDSSAALFAYVSSDGVAYYRDASYSIGVRPAFKLSTRSISDDSSDTTTGGIIAMPLYENIPTPQQSGWVLVSCPICGASCWETNLARQIRGAEPKFRAACTRCALKAGLSR